MARPRCRVAHTRDKIINYNALSLSIGGTVLEAIIAAVNLWTIIRMVIEKRFTDETPQEAAPL